MGDDIFTSMFSSVTGAASAVPAALGPWMQVFLQVGAPKIALRLAAQDPCSDPGCQIHAFGAIRCLRCGRVACPHHAFLAPTGDGICLSCAGVTLRSPSAPTDRPEVLAAFALLELDPVSDEAAVRKRVQRAQREAHPDKQRTPSEKQAAERRFKQIGAAFALIRKARGWS